LQLLSSACAALAAYFLWRWLRRSPGGNPAHARFPALALVFLGGVGGWAYWPTWQVDQATRRAGRAVSSIEGRPLGFVCGVQLDGLLLDNYHYGYVRWTGDGPEQKAMLRDNTCGGLVAFLARPEDLRELRREKVIAVHVLSHEARHMLGEMSEAQAECQALQRNAALARRLGASEEAARELALAYWQEIYPQVGGGYTSPDCRRGGALDENLATSPWNLKR
jgi:hypothetical protein